MKGNGSVVKGLLMITQIGISMIVPIFVGAFLGYWLDRWLKTSFLFLVFLLFGILAAFRNIYKLTKPFYAADLKREQAEQAYWDSLKNARTSGQQPDAFGQENLDAPPERQRTARADITVFKTRRELAEEEFAAWRRKREKNHDGGISHDAAVGHDSTARGGGAGEDDGK